MNQLALMQECFPGATIAAPDVSMQVVQDSNDGRPPEVLSHVGIYWRTLTFGDQELAIAGIGAVCTDPAHRCLGYASHLIEVAHREATRQGKHLAALFSDYSNFYEARGYSKTNVPTLLVRFLVAWEEGSDGIPNPDEVVDPVERW